MDYAFNWNLTPMSTQFDDDDKRWHLSVLHQWVRSGNTEEERNDRLFSTNLVILDHDARLKARYEPVCRAMTQNIRESTNSSEKSIHQMTSEIDGFFVLRFDAFDDFPGFVEMGSLFWIVKAAMVYFPINRLLHCVMSLCVVLYVASDFAELSTFLRVLIPVLLL